MFILKSIFSHFSLFLNFCMHLFALKEVVHSETVLANKIFFADFPFFCEIFPTLRKHSKGKVDICVDIQTVQCSSHEDVNENTHGYHKHHLRLNPCKLLFYDLQTVPQTNRRGDRTLHLLHPELGIFSVWRFIFFYCLDNFKNFLSFF